MPSSQAAATAAAERHNDRTPIPPEPPKLKTALKTPPKQATNPLQFVKVGPCSLYRTAQEQLQKVQEVKKIKQEIRDDPEDWQSNLDNWKSSRRKRQEHIIERVVEVKKLELEEHDRQRRRSKTFSEMMEERGNRGRKLSISLAVYNEEDANDLSDLGIGTSSGKSSVSGDTHDDTHSVLSDRDSEIDKNHSDVDNAGQENGPDNSETGASSRQNSPLSVAASATTTSATTSTSAASSAPNPPVGPSSSAPPLPPKQEVLNNGFHKATPSLGLAQQQQQQQEYDSGTTATVSSPEPEEYTYEGAIRGYVSRVSQNIPRRSLVDLDAKLPKSPQEEKSQPQPGSPVVKVDILKRREIFEKATRPEAPEAPKNGQLASSRQPEQQPAGGKSIKERLSILERQKAESEALDKSSKSPRHEAGPPQPIHRFVKPLSLPAEGKEPIKTRDLIAEELEAVKPLRERLSHLEKLAAGEQRANLEAATGPLQHNGDSLSPKSIKDRLVSLEPARALGAKGHQEKRPSGCYHEQTSSRAENNSTPSERSSSPDSEYRAPRATFHQSLDSLDADASSGPDTFERVQSLEELDYHQSRRYPASSSSAEILNDTDREDSGIHTADASCSVSQADEPIEEELGGPAAQQAALPDKAPLAALVLEEKTEFRGCVESTLAETSKSLERVEEKMSAMTIEPEQQTQRPAVPTDKGTAGITCSSSTCTAGEPLPAALRSNGSITEPRTTNAIKPHVLELWPSSYSSASSASSRPLVYQSPRVPPRRSPPELGKPSHLPVLWPAEQLASPKDESLPATESPSEGFSTPDSSSSNTICSLNLSHEPEAKPASHGPEPGSPSSAGQQAPCSPLPSPRSPSKIPTPLPRKSLPGSPVSPGHSSAGSSRAPSLPGSPVKLPRSCLPRAASEIPLPVRPRPGSPPASCPGSPPSPTTRLATRPATRPLPSPEAARRQRLLEVPESPATASPGQPATAFLGPGSCEVSAAEVRLVEQLGTASHGTS